MASPRAAVDEAGTTDAAPRPSRPQAREPVVSTNVVDISAESMLNLSLLDPPKYGWAPLGGVVDLLEPHERARRAESKDAYLKMMKEAQREKRKKRGRPKRDHVPTEVSSENSLSAGVADDSCFQSSDDGGRVSQRDNAGIASGSLPESAQNAAQSKTTSVADNSAPSTCVVPEPDKLVVAKERSGNSLKVASGRKGLNNVQQIDLDTAAGQDSVPCRRDEKSSPMVGKAGLDAGLSEQDTAVGSEILNDVSFTDDKKEGKDGDVEKVIKVKAMSDEGVLDIFSYHRGRVGCEPRGAVSGELLCDVDPTDTNHDWDRPKLLATVTVTFPLADPEETVIEEDDMFEDEEELQADIDVVSGETERKSEGQGSVDGRDDSRVRSRSTRRKGENGNAGGDSGKREKIDVSELPHFRDIIEWDLADPKFPTPMNFATNIASEYGLSFGQTMDLAASIQRQLDDFVRDNVPYDAPITFKDPLGNERASTHLGPPGLAIPLQLHGGHTDPVAAVEQRIHPITTKKPRKTAGGKRNAKASGPNVTVVPTHLLPTHGGKLPVRCSTKPGQQLRSNVTFSVEAEYRDEVLRRAKLECRAKLAKLASEERDDGRVGVLSYETNHVCHICHARKPHAAKFACGNKNHAFCENHCATRLGFKATDCKSGTMTLDHCPVCCVSCVCPKCARRLESVAAELKKECSIQGTDPQNVVMEVLPRTGGNFSTPRKKSNVAVVAEPGVESPQNLVPSPHAHATRGKSGKRESRRQERVAEERADKPKRPRKKKEKDNSPPICVRKVPALELPREICGGRDVDPSDPNDYRTVFKANGESFVRDDICDCPYQAPEGENSSQSVIAPVSKSTEEDGTVDFCLICRKSGDLVCCDNCPRAYHPRCASIDVSSLPESDWECPRCLRDKEEDEILGRDSLDVICAAFEDYNYCPAYDEKIRTLSKLHEMILNLMEYDFGYMFRDPVNPKFVPDYPSIIKSPMDYSTICKYLLDGEYAKRFKVNESGSNAATDDIDDGLSAIDNVILALLKDMELVWHNCWVYNQEGSAIYRMADVQRKKAYSIRKRSIDASLSDAVIRKLNEYIKTCDLERGKVVKKVEEHKRAIRKSRNQIETSSSLNATCRAVAVLDPHTNMIMKQYRSLKAAWLAARFLANVGYKSEIVVKEAAVKALVHKSTNDPSQLLFGYRWLFVDNLKRSAVTIVDPSEKSTHGNDAGSRKVVGGDSRSDSFIVERIVPGHARTLYTSVEEAYNAISLDSPQEQITRSDFQHRLLISTFGDRVNMLGSMWRRIKPGTESSAGELGSVLPRATNFSRADSFFRPDGLETSFASNIAILKKDMVSQVHLGGFETLQSAYDDWLKTRAASMSTLYDAENINTFEKHYVNGVRNVDGISWDKVDVSGGSGAGGAGEATDLSVSGGFDGKPGLKVEDLQENEGTGHPSTSHDNPDRVDGSYNRYEQPDDSRPQTDITSSKDATAPSQVGDKNVTDHVDNVAIDKSKEHVTSQHVSSVTARDADDSCLPHPCNVPSTNNGGTPVLEMESSEQGDIKCNPDVKGATSIHLKDTAKPIPNPTKDVPRNVPQRHENSLANGLYAKRVPQTSLVANALSAGTSNLSEKQPKSTNGTTKFSSTDDTGEKRKPDNTLLDELEGPKKRRMNRDMYQVPTTIP